MGSLSSGIKTWIFWCQKFVKYTKKYLTREFCQLHLIRLTLTVVLQTGEDHAQCANYHPILLINVDTKILTGVGKRSFKYHMLQCGPAALHNYTVRITCNFRLTDVQLTIWVHNMQTGSTTLTHWSGLWCCGNVKLLQTFLNIYSGILYLPCHGPVGKMFANWQQSMDLILSNNNF